MFDPTVVTSIALTGVIPTHLRILSQKVWMFIKAKFKTSFDV